jgi:hypothetical protein
LIFVATEPDPAWMPGIASGGAVLWLGQSWATCLQSVDVESLSKLVGAEWAAIYLDAPGFPAEEVRQATRPVVGRSRLRLLTDDPDAIQLAADTVPVYSLQGLDAAMKSVPLGKPSGPLAMLNRLKMLAKAPQNATVFAIGADDAESLQQLQEALALSPQFRRLVLISPDPISLEPLDGTDRRITRWSAPVADFTAMVARVAASASAPESLAVRIAGRTGFVSLDVSPCIDLGYPITDRFELITEHSVRREYTPTADALERYLNDPSGGWLPYATGIPFDRSSAYEKTLRKALEGFRAQGASASFTAWIPSEDGAGATTVLRQTCFNLARDGYPVLLAKADVDAFDFKQVTAFLTAASQRAAQADSVTVDVPWIVAFDAQHTERSWDFVAGLCNGLKKLMRSVVVLAVLPRSADKNEQRHRAAGTNKELGERLRNSISPSDAVTLGRHLNRLLPAHQHRSESEWTAFVSDSSHIDPTLGSRSLFWLALRFWLLRFRPSEGSFRQWFARKLKAIVNGNPHLYAAALEVASVSKYRLAFPSVLLPSDASNLLLAIGQDASNPIGLHRVNQDGTTAFAFSHPLIAEELLRIAKDDPVALAAVNKATCLNLLDLELHLMERLFSRKAIERRECIPMVEELVTSALRIDEREAPRNFEVRDRIVSLLERAPDGLWDSSQVFNHHLAKGRRHLAMKPPRGGSEWTTEEIREQLELAENHLLDALHRVQPLNEERRELPLNLYVSLALTYDARAKREADWGFVEEAARNQTQAEQAFRKAQTLDGDNTYVLENYARFLLYQAERLEPGDRRTRLLVDAIALVEQERLVDQSSHRDTATLEVLARALDCLRHGDGLKVLNELATDGSEAALVALAQITMLDEQGPSSDPAHWERAESLLRRVPSANQTWRSISALYSIVSKSRPFAFAERHELLESLAATEFAWPLQLRLERGVLLHQMGEHFEAQKVFTALRDDLPGRSSPLSVPPDLRYLGDPQKGFREPLVTTLVVQDTAAAGRNLWGIPDGWGSFRVPFRPYMFNRDVFRTGAEVACIIQFTNFGPQAVPPSESGVAR